MSGKMTDEELRRTLAVLGSTVDRAQDAANVRAHIAALTAERDNWKGMHEANVKAGIDLAKEFNRAGGVGHEVDGVFFRARALLAERDALRERVKALEARTWIQCTTASNDCLGGCRSMAEHDRYQHRALIQELENLRPLTVLHEDMTRLKRDAESRLADIRQRAGDDACVRGAWVSGCSGVDPNATVLRGIRAVARYIVGPNAPPSEMDGLRGEMAEPETKAERLLREDREASAEMVRKAAEPTTAEAFAILKANTNGTIAVGRVVSLLERRMGAMAWAIRDALAAFEVDYPEDAVHKALPLLKNALTGAPPITDWNGVADELASRAFLPSEMAECYAQLVARYTRK